MIIFFAMLCVYGIFTGKISLAIVFMMAVGIVIWTILRLFQKEKLETEEMISVIIGILALAYTICVLFLHIDVDTIMGLDQLILELGV